MLRRPAATCLVTAAALAALPTRAWAWAPAQQPSQTAQTGEATTAPEDDPALAQAEALYREGQGKFETADYDAAIELWTEAYTGVPKEPAYMRIRVLLLYNLATAQERAYEVDQDPRHLRQAQILLSNFERSLDAVYDRDDPAQAAEAEKERRRVTERLQEIEARIAAAEETSSAQPARADQRGHAPGSARPLIVSGGVLAGLGVAGLGLMAGGLVMGTRANDISGLDPTDTDGRRAQFDRGRLGNTLAIAGGVAGGALLVTGAVLLGVGLHRRARGREGAHAAVVPTLGGLAVAGRF